MEALEQLQAGSLDSVGGFTLDVEKAHAKLQQFQLAEPYHYVLQVVQAAALAGAARVRVRTDADDCLLWLDGVSFEGEDLESLYGSLFLAWKDPARRPLRELAIGLHGALSFAPALVQVDSWDGRRGFRLRLRKGSQEVTELSAEDWDAVGGLRRPARDGGRQAEVHVRERFGWSLLKRLVRSPEASALSARCLHSRLPVEVNGRRVDGPPKFGPGFGPQCEVRGEGFAAVLALPASPTALAEWHKALARRGLEGDLEVVLDGVAVCARPADGLRYAPVAAVVWATGLRKNLSQSDLVEDPTFKRMMADLRLHLKSWLQKVAEGWEGLPQVERNQAAPALAEAIRREIKADAYKGRWQAYKKALIRVPLFPLADGRTVPLEDLLEQYRELRHLPVSPMRPWPVPPPGGVLVAWFPEKAEGLPFDPRPMLREVFRQLQPAEVLLEQALQADRRRREWESHRPRRPLLTSGRMLVRTPLEGVEGEAGLPAEHPRLPGVLLLKQGRPLGTLWLPESWPSVAAVANHDALEPNDGWTGALEGPALKEVRDAVEAALPRLFRGLANSAAETRAACGHSLRFLGWAAGRKASDAPAAPPADAAPVPPGEPGGDWPWLDRLPLGWDVEDRLVRVGEAREEIARHGDLPVLTVGLPGGPVPLPRRTLRLSPDHLSCLRAFFGEERVRDARTDLQEALRVREGALRFQARTSAPLDLRRPCVARVAVEGPGLEGFLGLVLPGAADYRGIRLAVLYESRVLEVRTLAPELPACEAVVQSAHLKPRDDWSGPVEDGAWQRLVDGVLAALDGLARAAGPGHPALAWGYLEWAWGQGREVPGELLAAPLLPTAGGGRVSVQQLLDRGVGQYTSGPAPPDEAEVLLLEPRQAALLSGRGVGLTDAAPRLAARARERAFQERPADEVALPRGSWLVEGPLDPPYEGLVGVWDDLMGPREVLLFRERRLLERRAHGFGLPLAAAVNDDLLEADPSWSRAAPSPRLDALLQAVEQKGEQLVLEVLRRPLDVRLRPWILGLAAQVPADGAVGRQLRDLPLFSTTSGGRVGLGGLGQEYLPAADWAGKQVPLDLPLLPAEELRGVARLVPGMRDASRRVQVALTAERNRQGPRLPSLRLEDVFPEVRWLARLEVQQDGLRGQLGIPAKPGYGLTLCVDGLPLEVRRVPFVAGALDGPFRPNETWDGLDEDPSPLLEPLVERLGQALAASFPDPGHPDFPRAREAALEWILRTGPEPPPETAAGHLAGLHLFPMSDGRFVSVSGLRERIAAEGPLLYVPPWRTCPEGEAVLVLDGQGPLAQRLFPEGLRPWEPPPPETPPAPPPDPGQRLLETLREELRDLSGGDPALGLGEAVLGGLSLGPTPEGVLCHCEPAPPRLTLNPAHPAVARLLRAEGPPVERTALLLSALYSVLNRALPEVEDQHEREVHRRLLATLLGGAPPESRA